MIKILLSVLVALTVAGCNGGACTYEDMPFRARIVSIEKRTMQSAYNLDPANTDFGMAVKLATNIPSQDTLYLDEMVKQKTDAAFVAQHHLSEGLVLEGMAHVRTSGTCAPGGYRFSDSTLNLSMRERN
ncbi:hypothetical protein [Flavisolibacter nicotianae]|uniref:hypothetical protein n=1 Tax=Flavisolibacter nicotianae TaxID=2364882 RepID=UPI000EB44C1E|nr:hypothetical protein [Flavisolibacter nicotianae]